RAEHTISPQRSRAPAELLEKANILFRCGRGCRVWVDLLCAISSDSFKSLMGVLNADSSDFLLYL
ncbi:MAG TPA: hypothetical protein VMW24_03375, partial [Sedimentisphaerales bacterium]|nr:hypothetical protein [Sedimentisphaerales bacterium]